MSANRAVRLVAFAIAAFTSATALAGGPALVVELESGKVLHAERATDPWFPASITKLMTTYVALDFIRTNQASLETLLTVSDSAAAQPPSKMGFKPGTQVRLDNALKILMVKSANDVAATIAENLGGSIEGFADLMNSNAVRLGMRDSHFANPHGLPDERNQTTARDMAILARALLTEFPAYQELFHIGAIQYGRRIMRNTNGLIGRYPGADGMKTGFICSAGFNVVASATRNGRHLITVVMGAPSANERTMKAAELFDRGFNNQAGWTSPTLAALPASNATSPPDMRSVICDRRGPMPKEEDSPTTLAGDNGGVPNLFSSDMLAFAGGAQPLRTSLGPRSAVQPELVWVGLNPPSERDLAAEAAKEEAALKAKDAKAQKLKAAQEKAAKSKGKKDKSAVEAVATDDAADDKPAASKGKARAVISVKPVAGQAAAPAAKTSGDKTSGDKTSGDKTSAAKTPAAKTSTDTASPAKAAPARNAAVKDPAPAKDPAQAGKAAPVTDPKAKPKKAAVPAKPKTTVE
ncbi:D-alanyl-D-alanine carboxypeptidase family protein [Microvirga antarctica]|uniref:D-alanyl-D-alanine carboxypeptidase family protein n=1 Tax=Microvirga antarctica TaxID=2819233 RepID=UPI001B30C5F5|nr:D-alanyl-D-alanine carboxypeptidase family protein [Microvirga antarctica]